MGIQHCKQDKNLRYSKINDSLIKRKNNYSYCIDKYLVKS